MLPGCSLAARLCACFIWVIFVLICSCYVQRLALDHLGALLDPLGFSQRPIADQVMPDRGAVDLLYIAPAIGSQPCYRTPLFRPLGRIEIPDIFASIDPMLPDQYLVHWQFHLQLHRSARTLSQSKCIRDENRICARVSAADLLVWVWSCQCVKHKQRERAQQ